ncbi:MAG: helix-turn-helix domain-containing protein [Candidatus Omnitrophica bacterium]|nr:helix-turn-helix domain-containing protein [Candidatus Omnitrophota bacterium]
MHQFHLNSGGYQTKDLAEYLGVSTRTIQRWLKEKSDPDDKEMAQIREYLNKSRLEQESAL